jgi:hypothetical protein
MSKKSSRQVTSNRKAPAVEVRSIDELAVFSDEELGQRLNFLYNEASRRHETQAVPFEVEMAYVLREQDIRRTRKVRHREFMDKLRSEEVDESKLPEYQGNPPPYWLF